MSANPHVHHTCHIALKNVDQRRCSTAARCPVTVKDMQKISHTRCGIPEQKARNSRAKLQVKDQDVSGSMTALKQRFHEKSSTEKCLGCIHFIFEESFNTLLPDSALVG